MPSERRAEERLDQLIRSIAAELGAAELINYRIRRTALSGWQFDQETWQVLVCEARARTNCRNRALRPHDQVDRLAASVAVWQQATRGFYQYAPLLDAVPDNWHLHTGRVSWKVATGQGTSLAGIQLRRLLVDYAEQISRRIDAGWLGTTAGS